MRWSMARAKPSYLQYAALRKAYEEFIAVKQKAGPKAKKRFDQWLASVK